jgi:4-hydroxy-tetrahydrodipicolinate reductase
MSGIAIFGITGRMGQTLVRALREPGSAQPLHLVGALASPGSVRLGLDAAAEGAPTGVMVTADPCAALRDAAVAVDFSLPQCVADNARACMAARVPLLVGATGFDGATREALDAAAAVIPVLIAPNTSTGVNLVARLVKLATRALGPGYDVEISEAHHRMKRDAPSGTALALGEAVAAERGTKLADVAVFDRHGLEGPRRAGDIGFTVLRAGDIVGEHTVTFAIAGERVEITHRATDRVTFAHGALRAAAWLAGRPPGLYAMDEVLGLDQP